MKKTARKIIATIIVAIVICTVMIPATAATFDSDNNTGNAIGTIVNPSVDMSSVFGEEVDLFEMLDAITDQESGIFDSKVSNMYPKHNGGSNTSLYEMQDLFDGFDILTIIGSMMPIVVFVVFLIPGLFATFGVIATIVYYSITTMGKKELPVRRVTANTVRNTMPDRKTCPKCGKVFGDAEFCSDCGTPKKVKCKYVVPINGRVTAYKLEKMVNNWLAENPYIYDCDITLETRESLFIPFINWKFFVKKAVIEYSVADKPQKYQYGLAFLYKFRLFGPIGYSKKKHVAQWKNNNPDCRIVSTYGGRIQHWDSNGGFYAQYYNYVFFKK